MNFTVKDDNGKEVKAGCRVYCGSTAVRKPEDFGIVKEVTEPDEDRHPVVVVQFAEFNPNDYDTEEFPTHLPGPWHDYVCYDVEVVE